MPHISLVFCEMGDTTGLTGNLLTTNRTGGNRTGAHLMKAAHAGVGGARCRKSGYVGRKRWVQPNDCFFLKTATVAHLQHFILVNTNPPRNPWGKRIRFTLAV